MPPACSLWATRSRIWTRWEPPSACVAIARKKGVPAYIIRDEKDTPAEDLYQRVERMEEYKGRYLDTQEALLRADSRSLLGGGGHQPA